MMPARKSPKHESRPWKKAKARLKLTPEPLLEQPIADSTANVPCPVCGHAVDPKRMHPHMVRFHGAAIRSNGASNSN